jgi:hypothetical protein
MKGMTVNVISFSLVDLFLLELAPTAFSTISWKFYLVFISIAVCGSGFHIFCLHRYFEAAFGENFWVPNQYHRFQTGGLN